MYGPLEMWPVDGNVCSLLICRCYNLKYHLSCS